MVTEISTLEFPSPTVSCRRAAYVRINHVERLFAEVTRELLHHSDHRSVQTPEKDLRTWVKVGDEDPKLFIWTKPVEGILSSVARYLKRLSGVGR